MEHFGEELDSGWLVGVRFVKGEYEFKGSIFEWGVGRSEDDGVPDHEVVCAWCTGNTTGWVSGETLEVSDESLLRWCGLSEQRCGRKK